MSNYLWISLSPSETEQILILGALLDPGETQYHSVETCNDGSSVFYGLADGRMQLGHGKCLVQTWVLQIWEIQLVWSMKWESLLLMRSEPRVILGNANSLWLLYSFCPNIPCIFLRMRKLVYGLGTILEKQAVTGWHNQNSIWDFPKQHICFPRSLQLK